MRQAVEAIRADGGAAIDAGRLEHCGAKTRSFVPSALGAQRGSETDVPAAARGSAAKPGVSVVVAGCDMKIGCVAVSLIDGKRRERCNPKTVAEASVSATSAPDAVARCNAKTDTASAVRRRARKSSIDARLPNSLLPSQSLHHRRTTQDAHQ